MKKILSLFLAAVMILGSVSVALADETVVEIGSVSELVSAANAINADSTGGAGKTYRLTADIDFQDSIWSTYIGTGSNPFKGTFDGNGHIIRNFKINAPGANSPARCDAGIFGYVAGDAVIKNVGVANAVITLTGEGTWQNVAGGLVAALAGNAKAEGCFAKNITLELAFERTGSNGQIQAGGGLVGKIESTTASVINCYAIGSNMDGGEVDWDGGLIGALAEKGTVDSCYSDTTIVRSADTSHTTVTNCYYAATPGWPAANYAGEKVETSVLKTKAADLGEAYQADSVTSPINNGYPILLWEADIAQLEGAGTYENPYLIKDAENLAQVSAQLETEGKYYKLANDIDLEDVTWSTYIGTASRPFKGIFDGNGYVIKNYNLKAPEYGLVNYLGLFAYVGGSAVIKNVGIENVTAGPVGDWGYNAVCGGLVGIMQDNATVKNSFVKGITFFKGDALFTFDKAGGLIGVMNGSGTTVKNCYSNGFADADNSVSNDSGLIGVAENFESIENCYSTTTLTMCTAANLSKVSNSYFVEYTTGVSYYMAGTEVSAENLKTMATQLGTGYAADASEGTNNTEINDGYPVLGYQAGLPIEDDAEIEPVEKTISSYEEFKAIAAEVAADPYSGAGYIYKLTADLDLENVVWQHPIGTEEKPFKGTFDGDGHIIKNFRMGVGNAGVNGLFKYIGGNAVIKNLGVEDAMTSFSEWSYHAVVGGIVGYAMGNATVQNCYAKNIGFTDIAGWDSTLDIGEFGSTAGLIGRIESAGVTVKNCYALNCNKGSEASDVTAHDGGIVGFINANATIENCYSDSTIAKTVASMNVNISNTYAVESDHWAESGENKYIGEIVSEDVLKTKASVLGSAFKDGASINDGYPALSWEKSPTGNLTGKGTAAEPYIITNKEDLIQVSQISDTEGKYFVLANDIDLGGEEWVDYIGTSTEPFKGDFNGNGHIISNYKITLTAAVTRGLFAFVGGNAHIYNMGVEDASFVLAKNTDWDSTAGGIIGKMQDNACLTGCFAKNISFSTAFDRIGALAEIKYGGGLVGLIDGAGCEIRSCYAKGIKDDKGEEERATVNHDGGLAGAGDNFLVISDCYSDTTLVRYKNWLKVENSFHAVQPAEWPTSEGYTWGDIVMDVSSLGYDWCYDFEPVADSSPQLKWESHNDMYLNLVNESEINATKQSGADFGRNSMVMALPENTAAEYTLGTETDSYYRVSFKARAQSGESGFEFKLGDIDLAAKLADKTLGEEWETKTVYVKAAATGDTKLAIKGEKAIYADEIEVTKIDAQAEKTAIENCIVLGEQYTDATDEIFVTATVCDGVEVIYTDNYNCFDDNGYLIEENVPIGLGTCDVKVTGTAAIADIAVTADTNVKIRMRGFFEIENIGLVDADNNEVCDVSKAAKIGTVNVKKNAQEEGKLFAALYNNDVLIDSKIVDIPENGACNVDMTVSGADKVIIYVFKTEPFMPVAYQKESLKAIDENDKITVYTIGDSLCADYDESSELRGWGQLFENCFDEENITFDNSLALSGITIDKVISSGRMDTLINNLKKDDYVLIQLGTNDSYFAEHGVPGYSREGYRYRMGQLVTGIIEKGATPVLITPPERLSAATDTKTDGVNYDIDSWLAGYPDILREMAEEKEIHLIDLNAETVRLFKELGYTGVKNLGYFVSDELHFNESGATYLAEFIANGLVEIGLPFGNFVVTD